MGLALYLGIVEGAEEQVADALTVLSDRHSTDADVRDTARLLARWSRRHLDALDAPIARYGVRDVPDPARLRSGLLHGNRVGGVGLLRDVHDLLALITYLRAAWIAVYQAAMELHDSELAALCTSAGEDVDRQVAWLETRVRLTAPQALTVPPNRRAELRASVPTVPTPAAVPDIVWTPLAGALLVGVVGAMALVTRQMWLLPSLGPSVYLLAQMPAHPSGRMYNVVAGHLLGVAAGIAAVWVTGAANAPLEPGALSGARVGAATLSIALTVLLTLALKAAHPPAAATTLLVALGWLHTTADVVHLAAGAIVVALAGAVLRRLRLGRWPRRQITHEPAPAGEPEVTRPTADEMKKAA